jgi:hypothetical protein
MALKVNDRMIVALAQTAKLPHLFYRFQLAKFGADRSSQTKQLR